MKLLAKLIFSILLLFTWEVKAQYVTINDPNLLAWMSQPFNMGLAITGNQLDTTHSVVTSYNIISITDIELFDISPLQYFDSLNMLVLARNSLTTIPTFAESLEYIYIVENSITDLPQLPSGLKELYLYDNNLSSLPPLPSSLTYLDARRNQLTSLPTLNANLQTLEVEDNLLTQLPILPSTLSELFCSRNLLSNLPSLPSTLYFLSCSYNNITDLPLLTSTLTHFHASYNNISSLPDTLPNQLYDFRINNNNISNLPTLPQNIGYLVLDSNQISCFPNFPPNLNFLSLTGNQSTCLPNYVSCMDSYTNSFPLCVQNDTLNNPNNCAGSNFVGTIAHDLNIDCQIQNESKLKNVPVKIYDENETLIGSTLSSETGNFYYSNTVENYTIKIDTNSFRYTASCDNPGYDTTINPTTNDDIIQLDFGFICPDTFDLLVHSIVNNGITFPGQVHTLNISASELANWYGFDCFSDLSGTLTITAVGPIEFEGVPPTAITPEVNGFTYSYNISDFTTVTDNSFELNFLVDTTAQAGDNVTIYAEILSNDNEINISNNSMVFNYQVVNSYDPNLKEVYPQQVLPGYDDYLTYTIHFQNLGTAPAFNIRIADTLSNNLDVETFQVINYSAPNTITINNNILQVRFPNIMLPDSASNPEGSKGFIQYKIKPKSGLAVDSTIKNTAYIYFDFNPAVVTNIAITEYVETLDVAKIEKENSFKIFPNPSNGQINITTDLKLNGEIKIQLFDLSGKELEIDKIENMNSSNWKIDLNENSGFYILKITDSEGNVFKKKIVLN